MYQQLPKGARPILVQSPADGKMYPNGWAILPNGGRCQCQVPPNWVAQSPQAYNRNAFVLLSPGAQAQVAQQVAQGSANIGNTFTRIDLPGQGAAGVARKEGVTSPMDADFVYTLILNNTAGVTKARKFIGDYTGTYVLQGNTELTPAGFAIDGVYSTSSLSQLIARMTFRPISVSKIQFIASNQLFFNQSNSYYFDTRPVNNPTKDSLVLTGLLDASQYNPTIQWWDKSVLFDGVNGLDIEVPAGQSVTLQFYMKSERSAGDQVLYRS